MKTVRTSSSTVFSITEDGKYYVSHYNKYTAATNSYELIFDENGKCFHRDGHCIMNYDKSIIDVNMATQGMFNR